MTTREQCVALDAEDALAALRDRFHLPDGVIYLDGNSLGALPKAAAERAHQVIRDEWGEGLIRSWNDSGWIDLPFAVGGKLARLIGAEPGEVVATDSTSVNLFKLLAAALRLNPERRVVLTDSDNFPTDNYITEGLLDMLGERYERRLAPEKDIVAAIDETVAVVSLTHVNYRTGRLYDMAKMTAAARAKGALMLWDLSHSAGAVPVDLNGCGVDLAVGCGYKYLNGGPGAPAYLFVAKRHHQSIRQPLTGWMGHAAPFDFAPGYRPAAGIARMLAGTPSVVAMSILDSSLDVLLEAGTAALRQKSTRLTDLFIELVESRCAGLGLSLQSPKRAAQRGSQVSYRHDHGYPAMQALIARGVIGDFRAPDIMRFGFAPLYLRHVDVWDAVSALAEVLANEEWREARFQRLGTVT